MADGKKKQPLSVNQLHNRHLIDLSASQAKPKSKPVDGNTQLEPELGWAAGTAKRDHDFSGFDFGTPEQEKENVEEPMSKVKDSSPRLFSGITDFDSPSSTLAFEPHERGDMEEDGSSSEAHLKTHDSCDYTSNSPVDMEPEGIEQGSCKIFEKEDSCTEKDSSESGVAVYNSTYPGEDRQTKVRIEGRRRLCKISKDNDGGAGAGQNFTSAEDPKVDGLFDFDSPLQMDKTSKKSGNDIRDILNDLSSRLDILSIEKKRVPKKVGLKEGFHESARSKLNDAPVKEGTLEIATSSNLVSSDSAEEIVEVQDDNCVSKANRTMCKCEEIDSEEHTRARVKSGFGKEPQVHCFRREEKEWDIKKYVALSKMQTVKQVERRHEKFIELTDDESDEVTTLDDHADDFTLTGPKSTYKLPGKIATMLYPHQREGLKWLWSFHCMGKGGILGDDMGLGKTMQLSSWIVPLKFDTGGLNCCTKNTINPLDK